jgi:hypothetical protein
LCAERELVSEMFLVLTSSPSLSGDPCLFLSRFSRLSRDPVLLSLSLPSFLSRSSSSFVAGEERHERHENEAFFSHGSEFFSVSLLHFFKGPEQMAFLVLLFTKRAL